MRRTPWRMNRSELDAVDVLAVGRGRSETLLIPCSCSSEHMSDVWVVVAFVHRLSLAGQKRVVTPPHSEQSAFPSKRKWQVGWRSGIAFWLLSDSQYGSVGNRDGVPLLVEKYQKHRWLFAAAVPNKRVTQICQSRHSCTGCLWRFTRSWLGGLTMARRCRCGHRKLQLGWQRSMVSKFQRTKTADDSHSNGLAEHATRRAKAKIRKLKKYTWWSSVFAT